MPKCRVFQIEEYNGSRSLTDIQGLSFFLGLKYVAGGCLLRRDVDRQELYGQYVAKTPWLDMIGITRLSNSH